VIVAPTRKERAMLHVRALGARKLRRRRNRQIITSENVKHVPRE